MGSQALNPADFYSVALTNVFQHKILKAFKDSEILNQKLKESTNFGSADVELEKKRENQSNRYRLQSLTKVCFPDET